MRGREEQRRPGAVSKRGEPRRKWGPCPRERDPISKESLFGPLTNGEDAARSGARGRADLAHPLVETGVVAEETARNGGG